MDLRNDNDKPTRVFLSGWMISSHRNTNRLIAIPIQPTVTNSTHSQYGVSSSASDKSVHIYACKISVLIPASYLQPTIHNNCARNRSNATYQQAHSPSAIYVTNCKQGGFHKSMYILLSLLSDSSLGLQKLFRYTALI